MGEPIVAFIGQGQMMDERPDLDLAGAIRIQRHAPFEFLDLLSGLGVVVPEIRAQLHPVEPRQIRLLQLFQGDVPPVHAFDGDQDHLLGVGRDLGVFDGHGQFRIGRQNRAGLRKGN